MADSLVAAKQEYTQQLCDLLCPSLFEGFKSIWKTCKTSDSTKKLKSFQEKLVSVPLWNQNIIDNEYSRICKKEETKALLDKLIEAVFLSNVKVLSTIRLGKIKPINITIPETKKFLHQCYIEGARKLWQDPHLIDDRSKTMTYSEIKRNEKRLLLNLSESVEKTVSKLIPIQNILEVYLSEMSGSEKDVNESDEDNSSIKETDSHEEIEKETENEYRDDSLFMSEESSVIPEESSEPIISQEPETQENKGPSLLVSEGNTITEAAETTYPDVTQESIPKISINIKPQENHSVDVSNQASSPDPKETAFFSDSDED